MTDWVVLARLRRARGIRGELVAENTGSTVERFEAGLRVFLGPPDPPAEASIERAWVHNGELVLKFAGVDTRTDAEALRGKEVRIPVEDRPPAPEGEFYLSDLVGCRVETSDGRLLGVVREVHDYGAAPVLNIATEDGGELMAPFVEGIYTEVDLEGRRVVVNLPEGLEELYRR